MSQTTTYTGSAGAKSAIETSTIRAISWRLIPFLVLAYFFSYLDRVNVSIASLTMNPDLKITPLAKPFSAKATKASIAQACGPSALRITQLYSRRSGPGRRAFAVAVSAMSCSDWRPALPSNVTRLRPSGQTLVAKTWFL